MKFNKLRSLLLCLPFLFVALEAEDRKFNKKQLLQNQRIMQKLRLDIAELKGPPDVEQVKQKHVQNADDLLLVINSGRYEGERLERLKALHLKMLNRPEPTQETVNRAHRIKIKKMSHKNKASFKKNNMADYRKQHRQMNKVLKRNPNKK